VKAFAPALRRTFPLFAAAVVAATLAFAASPAFAQGDDTYDPWSPGRQWMTVRAGYAKSTEDSAGHGLAGYGMSYRRMLKGLDLWGFTPLKQYSIGVAVQHDVVSRFGPASEVDFSATVDLIRHYAWAPAVHPYLGLGVGPYYRKTYRTGDDVRDIAIGWYVTGGIHTPVSGRNLLGVDFRLARVKDKNEPPNPVFGLGAVDEEVSGTRTVFKERRASHWSIKAEYAFTF